MKSNPIKLKQYSYKAVPHIEHQAVWTISATSLRKSWTTFTVWMPLPWFVSSHSVPSAFRTNPLSLSPSPSPILCGWYHSFSSRAPDDLSLQTKSVSLIESIERQLLDEGESVNQDIVALCSELHSLHFLTFHDRSHIGFADTHYPVFHDLSSHRRIAGSGCKGSLRDIP